MSPRTRRNDGQSTSPATCTPLTPERFAEIMIPHGVTVREGASSLSSIVRFAGNTLADKKTYSVAQHSVIGARETYRESGDPVAALCFLAHDMHEKVIGDMTTPLSVFIAGQGGTDHLSRVKAALDARIFPRLSLPWPLVDRAPMIAALVKMVDARMGATELRDVADPAHINAAYAVKAEPFKTPISIAWPWAKAEEKFIEAWDEYAGLAGLASAREIDLARHQGRW